MHSRLHFFSIALLGLTSLASVAIAADCPTFVQKDNSTIASSALVPAGFMIYNKLNSLNKEVGGVYKTPLNSFSETVIPSTQNDPPTNLDMTWDGQWIVYLHTTTRQVIVVRVDGSDRTVIPTPGVSTGFPKSTGFWHNGAKGLEIFYTSSNNTVRSVGITLPATGTPTVGGSRVLLQMSGTWVFDYTSFYAYQSANGKHFVTQMMCLTCGPTGKEIRRFGFFTLPMDTTSIATLDSAYTFADMPDTNIYGCGFSLSEDGKMVIANPGSQGDLNCVPNRESKLDHKGFMIEPFKEVSDAPITVHQIIDSVGISVNWAPVAYRFGLHYEVDFSNWHFVRGSQSFVSGTLTGAWKGTLVRGLWLVNWKTNTWHQISNTNLVSNSAIAAFTNGDPIKVPLTLKTPFSRVTSQEALYTINGKRLSSKSVNTTNSLGMGVHIRTNGTTLTRIVSP